MLGRVEECLYPGPGSYFKKLIEIVRVSIGVVNQQGTIYISEWDNHQGPFPDNHALLKAIAATKQNSAYLWGNWVRGNPDP